MWWKQIVILLQVENKEASYFGWGGGGVMAEWRQLLEKEELSCISSWDARENERESSFKVLGMLNSSLILSMRDGRQFLCTHVCCLLFPLKWTHTLNRLCSISTCILLIIR